MNDNAYEAQKKSKSKKFNGVSIFFLIVLILSIWVSAIFITQTTTKVTTNSNASESDATMRGQGQLNKCNIDCSYDKNICTRYGLICAAIKGSARKQCRNPECTSAASCSCESLTQQSTCTTLTDENGRLIIVRPGDNSGTYCQDYCWLDAQGKQCRNLASDKSCYRGECAVSIDNHTVQCCVPRPSIEYPTSPPKGKPTLYPTEF